MNDILIIYSMAVDALILLFTPLLIHTVYFLMTQLPIFQCLQKAGYKYKKPHKAYTSHQDIMVPNHAISSFSAFQLIYYHTPI